MPTSFKNRSWPPAGLALSAAALMLPLSTAVAFAATCPTTADPLALVSATPGQAEIEEVATAGLSLDFTGNPLFEAAVAAGTLPPVEERLPDEPLVVLPYVECGVYGGTLDGLARAPESGTSDILSWRQVNLVRIADDMQSIVPNVARSWSWNDDYTSIEFELRRGHKWSDGAPFTAEDVVFFFEDIVNNSELNPTTPVEWGKGVQAEAIDETHVRLTFDEPFPGLLNYIATSGSYFAVFAPKHHFMQYHAAHNADADAEAKSAGFEGWVNRFGTYYHKWKDAETLTAHSLEVPTLESHLIEIEPTTQGRMFRANPYYFKVDSSGQQLPYIDHQSERFVTADLQVLAILNGEVDFKSQGVSLNDFPTYKEGEQAGGYTVMMSAGSRGPLFAFNITHADPRLRAVYGDLRFRQAVSHAIDRAEINEVLFFGLGQPSQALPARLSFATDDNINYMIDYDLDKANALLDEIGMVRGSDGVRQHPDGSQFTILWEYSSQFASPELVKLMTDYLNAVGLSVNTRELPSAATRENAKAGISDINMEWDVPYEPTLIADVMLYVPYYSDTSPLFGVGWRQWYNSNGAEGEEPPAWVKEMYTIAQEWKTTLPGTERYMELGRELIQLNQENMTLVGTIGDLPRPAIVSNNLHNMMPGIDLIHYNFGYLYGYRPDQWFLTE